MTRTSATLLTMISIALASSPAHADLEFCRRLLVGPRVTASIARLKNAVVNTRLDLMARRKGLPEYLGLIEELKTSGRYRDDYANFGEMGLAEMGISVRYNQARLDGLNTGRPLIIVANHHLGIADGLALQHMAGKSRTDGPSLLFLARWIEKLLPHAVYGDEHGWGTAVPVEINLPKKSDPEFERKMAEVKTFNTSWSRTSLRVLKKGGALIVFPAGHVASMNADGEYPVNVYDEPDSWQDGFLNLARLGRADVVFAYVDSVNSEAFYRDRKRFGGGDKERVIWFSGEALAKKGEAVDVYLSKPMGLAEVYDSLSERYGLSRAFLEREPRFAAELMRRSTYSIRDWDPQPLDVTDSPRKK